MKLRIVRRTYVGGRIRYIIQKKRFLFGWWVDCNDSYKDDTRRVNDFPTLLAAKNNLHFFDGSKNIEQVVYVEDTNG